MNLVRISILIILSSYAMGNEWSEWSSYEIEPIKDRQKVTKPPTTAIMIIGGYGGGNSLILIKKYSRIHTVKWLDIRNTKSSGFTSQKSF